ncbi:uncharacterized protein LOC133657452 isoform X2 [Entelurus aequoreus]|nr:uncharacterized protein LOC133657452 isoform X2 [Entelurus aequoreus]
MAFVPSLQNISEEDIFGLLYRLYKDLASAKVLPKEVIHKRRRKRRTTHAHLPQRCFCDASTETDLLSLEWILSEDESFGLSDDSETMTDISQGFLPPLLVETMPDIKEYCFPTVPVHPMPDMSQCFLPPIPVIPETPLDMKSATYNADVTQAQVSQKLVPPPNPTKNVESDQVNTDERQVIPLQHASKTEKAGSKAPKQNPLLNKHDKKPGPEKAKSMNRATLLVPDKPGATPFTPKKAAPKNRLKPIESKNPRIAQRQKPGIPELQPSQKTQEPKKPRVSPYQVSASKRPEKTEAQNRLTILEANSVLPGITSGPKRPKTLGITSTLPEVRRTWLSLRRIYGPEKPKVPATNIKPKQPWRNPLSDPPRREGPPRVYWIERERARPVQNRPSRKVPGKLLL